MKTCFKCGEIKELNEFYKHKQMKDGHLNKCKACTINDATDDYKKNTFVRNKAKTKWMRGNYLKRIAHVALNNALRDGKILKSNCEECSSDKSQAHHDDYSKPLIVKWLCPKCHSSLHMKQRYLS